MKKSIFDTRVGYNPLFSFFDERDYPNLLARKSPFKYKNTSIYGKFYYMDKREYQGLVILSHGFGGGHKAYSSEIFDLATRGYIVYAYDNLGTCMSKGKCIYSASEAARIVLYAYEHAKEKYDLPITLLGHSMGAYSVLVASLFIRDDIKVCAMAAPNNFLVSLSNLVQMDAKRYVKKERRRNREFANVSLQEKLKNTTHKTFLVYGALDPIVKSEEFHILMNSCKDNPLVEGILVEGKMHNPDYSNAAIAYAMEEKLFLVGSEAKDYSHVDFKKVCELDVDVMNKIDAFMKGR